jgi:Spy/CpxP family protein refolding chaperone
MLRKTILALAATAALGAAALSPTAASAHWGGGWHHGGWYRGPFVRVYAGPGYGGCMVRRWVYTPYGPALRWVNVCY